MSIITTTTQVRSIASDCGSHFFDASALRFFGSRIHRAVYGGRFFVTSEQYRSLYEADGPRLYSVRRFEIDGDRMTFDTVDESGSPEIDAFQKYSTRAQAHAAALAAARADVTLSDYARFADALDGYLEALLWSSTVYGEEYGEDSPADSHSGPSAGLIDSSTADLRAFLALVWEQRLNFGGLSDAQIGHDFALTRNGHGAGFWDRGLGILGERLSDAARSFGTADVYLRADDTVDVIF